MYFFREESEGVQLLLENPKSMKEARFHAKHEIKFIIHGMGRDRNDGSMKPLRKGLYTAK